jgi:hypothetical protein
MGRIDENNKSAFNKHGSGSAFGKSGFFFTDPNLRVELDMNVNVNVNMNMNMNINMDMNMNNSCIKS